MHVESKNNNFRPFHKQCSKWGDVDNSVFSVCKAFIQVPEEEGLVNVNQFDINYVVVRLYAVHIFVDHQRFVSIMCS